MPAVFAMKIFQLTRSRGAWQSDISWPEPLTDFNSHAHVERDWHVKAHADHTENFNSHAHVERDENARNEFYKQKDFNSHAHVERDGRSNSDITTSCISTHTLTWSVTISIPMTGNDSAFQLTRSRGAWLQEWLAFTTPRDFNSHAHVERDGKISSLRWIN